MDCVFCKMVAGEIKPEKIYESEHFFAILDANPITKGHSIIISKRHFKTIFEMNDVETKQFGIDLFRISTLLGKTFGKHMNISSTSGEYASQSVPHFHLHFIPRQEGDRLWDGDKSRLVLDRSSGFPRMVINADDLRKLAMKLRSGNDE
ncbi:MAG: HIT family protein [Candidatus Aenigmatarchaeota archaeon]